MNNFLKYIIYFLLGLMIHFLFKNKLIEGYPCFPSDAESNFKENYKFNSGPPTQQLVIDSNNRTGCVIKSRDEILDDSPVEIDDNGRCVIKEGTSNYFQLGVVGTYRNIDNNICKGTSPIFTNTGSERRGSVGSYILNAGTPFFTGDRRMATNDNSHGERGTIDYNKINSVFTAETESPIEGVTPFNVFEECCKSLESPISKEKDNINYTNLLFRIIGKDENSNHKTQYHGCQNYTCNNKENIFDYEYLIGKPLGQLKGDMNNYECNKYCLHNGYNEDLKGCGYCNSTEDMANCNDIPGLVKCPKFIDELPENIKNILDDNYYIDYPNNKSELVRNIIKSYNSNKYMDKDYNDNIDYLTCNNEQNFSPNSLLKNKCNHKKCCFNTKCSSNDVKELKESELSGNEIQTLCPSGKKFKHYSNCRDIENCRDNFELYCCSSEIDQEVQDIFNSIDTDNDNKISKTDIYTYLNSEYSDSLTELNINKLNKLLAVDTDNELQINPLTNIQLDVYDFNDLLNE